MKRIRSEVVTIDRLQAWKIAEKILPEYSKKQYDELRKFISNGGCLAPLIVAENYRLIDGYNRWRLAKSMNMSTLPVDIYDYEDEKEMEVHAIVLNSKRRHLNKIQVARAAARLAEVYKEPEPISEPEPTPELPVEEVEAERVEQDLLEPAETDELVVEPAGIEDDDTPSPAVPLALPNSRGQVKAERRAAKELGVSQTLLKQVHIVDSTSDDQLIQAMETKVLTVKRAAEIAELPDTERQRLIEEASQKNLKSNEAKLIEQVIKGTEGYGKRLHRLRTTVLPSQLSDAYREDLLEALQENATSIEAIQGWLTDLDADPYQDDNVDSTEEPEETVAEE